MSKEYPVCRICGELIYSGWGWCPGCHHPYDEEEQHGKG